MSGRSVAPDFLARQPASGEWRLVGRHCDACGEHLFGRVDIACPRCGDMTLEDVVLPDEGAVWAFTVLRNPPPGRRRAAGPPPPYAVGLVDLDGVGLRVLAQLELAADRVAVGVPVRLSTRELFDDDGETIVGFSFTERLA